MATKVNPTPVSAVKVALRLPNAPADVVQAFKDIQGFLDKQSETVANSANAVNGISNNATEIAGLQAQINTLDAEVAALQANTVNTADLIAFAFFCG